jgi:uncharacterized protein (TIGR02757 family)
VNREKLKALLDRKVMQFNQVTFIEADPVSIPHQFTKKQDIEIAAFFTAIISWGQRKTILQSATRLMELMDFTPHDFLQNHTDQDLKRFEGFVHRTFNATDLYYLIHVLKFYYQKHEGLEDLFLNAKATPILGIRDKLIHFHNQVFDFDFAPERTRKHIATPERNSACKRLNMFLRWMVRKDGNGVDFGIWERITPQELMCPLDVHVHRVALDLGLMSRTQADWKAAEELTAQLRLFCPDDPVKYDFALFGIGLESKHPQ